MTLSDADRALWLRQLRRTVGTVLVPELSSAQARDSAALIDRILVQLIVDGELSDPVEPEPALLEDIDARRVALFSERAGDSQPTETASVTTAELTEYLRGRLGEDVTVDEITLIPGGRSKETLLVALRHSNAWPPRVVVRKDRPVGLLQTRAADEFELLAALHAWGVPVPKPYFADADGEVTLEVLEWVPGHKAGEYFPDLAAPTEHQAELGRQIAAALGRLHSMPLDHLARTPIDTSPKAETVESIRATVDAIVGRIGQLSGPVWQCVATGRDWLHAHAADAVSDQRALLQSDFGFHNMLIDGHRLTALVDWEAAAVGPPSRELAAAWNPIAALMPWPEFVDAYVAAGGSGDAADPKRVGFYRVFMAMAGLMTSRLGGHMFRTGEKRDLLTAHSGLDSQFRCARNLARALNDVG